MSFKLVCTAKADNTIPVHKYKSELTGLTVVLGEVEGPVVNGFFTLATEAHDDDGLPHTLEHLIFLGSELYPYKGVLDLLANRCLASGTNAWTDTDHTCYTMTTAGCEGFLELLPIFLDHILYPTLTDAGFITEVHHINDEGEDGGVVYCEMQGRENTGESRAHLCLSRNLYPNCGYCAETGGIMDNLRTSTNNKKVVNYHKEFYRPENLTIIITGQVDINRVFEVLKPLEQRIVEKGKLGEFKRPWQTPVEPLKESNDLKIVFPSDEEDCGLVYIGWRGPKAAIEYQKLTACSVLLRYLSDTSVSPLQREFVEIDDPFASKINHNIGENSVSTLYLLFENVPIGKIDQIYPKLTSVLNNIIDGTEKIDMKRMKNIIERLMLEALSNLENDPHEAIAFLIIGDLLYGNSSKDFEQRLNVNKIYEELRLCDENFWLNILKEYLIDGHHISVRAMPSIEEQQQMSKEESERIEKQRNLLGETGLREKGNQLADAMLKNDIQPPVEMLTNIPVPSTDGMKFHPVEVYRAGINGNGTNPPGLNLFELPLYTEAYNVHTKFVYIITSMDTSQLKSHMRPYLLLLLELFMESPVRRGNLLIPYEEVVAALESDTISSGTRLGLESDSRFTCGPFSNTASLMLQVESKKYERGVEWLSDLLHNTEFTVERIKVCAAKMANDVAQAKRVGNSIARELLKAMYFNKDTNVQLASMLRQFKFLTTIIEKLDNPETAESVINDLNSVRNIITSKQHLAIHLAADFERLFDMGVDLNQPWLKLFPRNEVQIKPDCLKVIFDWELMNFEGLNPNIHGTIVGLGCVESVFLYSAAPAIRSFQDEDLPPLLLFLQYLTQLEGPLWRQIRGQGLAYGYSILPRPNEGLLYFMLYRATNVVAAYKETKMIIEGQLNKNSTWDKTLLESARSSLIFELIEKEKCIGDLVVQSLLSSFKKVPCEYSRLIIKKVGEVTELDLERVGKRYVTKLFSTESKTSIICHPDKANDISTAFKQFGFDLPVEKSLEDSILGSCY